ncbi:MAG: recombination mediator RecR [Fastidiosipilaceae bacterium]|jgi:recombination protein RecR|nr:recombination protein RecR [Clostridiaceae bacterium]
MADFDTPYINELINQFGQLPGIGKKTAQRLAFHILSQPEEKSQGLARAILNACENIHLCNICCNLSDRETCDICTDESRDQSVICVVESPLDVAAMERTREYHGLYHVLHGAISPMQDVGPEQLHLRELLTRLQKNPEIQEIILANNATIEGEATATYIARLLKGTGIRTTRIAQGLPMGSNIEFTDEVTLAKALLGRQTI